MWVIVLGLNQNPENNEIPDPWKLISKFSAIIPTN